MNRCFYINQNDGSIKPTAVQSLDILAFYAYDDKSALQALQLLQSEFHSHHSDPKNWRFSDVTQSVLHALNKRSAQVYLSGIVALIMAHLNEDGSPTSINEASKIASELAYSSDKILFKVPKPNGWDYQEKAIVGDISTIKSYFRKYRSAAHICAAKTLIGADSGPSHPMVQPLPKTLKLVSTVSHYQRIIEAWPSVSDWNLWKVQFEGGTIENSYPPVTPSNELVSQIRSLRPS
ncbi:hypothetical protein [Ruegeria sp. HKCCA5463]|uniref:hypothetical protein n=1 Tax=Ruegeria sp. HKCCA5463 TaxID=2682994 RepID=UPI001489713D|nr:hypothetical protein [Ruegeria sp. HKCCA5463]